MILLIFATPSAQKKLEMPFGPLKSPIHAPLDKLRMQ
jgi:hypothetical protein